MLIRLDSTLKQTADVWLTEFRDRTTPTVNLLIVAILLGNTFMKCVRKSDLITQWISKFQELFAEFWVTAAEEAWTSSKYISAKLPIIVRQWFSLFSR